MSKTENSSGNRENARSWDPYFKQSNVKKLKNLLDNALKHDLTYVTIKNKKTGQIKTIDVFDLEQLIKQKDTDKYIKHYLNNNDDNVIPWYTKSVDLELIYKDQENNIYNDSVTANLTDFQTEYIFSKSSKLSPTTIAYTHNIIGNDNNFYDVNYQLYVQRYPSNKVFVNKSQKIDLFTYNISYLYVGERIDGANSNNSINDFVPFVTNFELYNNRASYYTSKNVYKNSFISQIKDVNNKTGLTYNNNTYSLSYVTNNNGTALTKVSSSKTQEGGEMWTIGNNIYLVPQYSSNFNAQKNHPEISTAYSQIGMIFTGNNVTSNSITINPYISGSDWYKINNENKHKTNYVEIANQYKQILEHVDLLQGKVITYTHPITCKLSGSNSNTPYDDNNEINIEYTYLSNLLTVDIADKNNSAYLKYAYTIDNSNEQLYDFNSTKYTYTYNGTDINLCKCTTAYTLYTETETSGSYDGPDNNKTNIINNTIIKFKSDKNNLWGDDYTLITRSSLTNPITKQVVSNPVPLTFKFVPKSKPYLLLNDYKIKSNVGVDIFLNSYLNIELSFTYQNAIIHNSYSYNNVAMFHHQPNENWTYNNSLDLTNCLFVYSYLFDNGGIVNSLLEGTFDTYTSNCNLDNGLSVQYSYDISNDMTQLTKPKLNIISEPKYDVTYIGDKTVVHIISDDFNIWGDDIKTFNTVKDTTYFGKNSYILCDSTNNEPLTLTYKHKSEEIINTLEIETYNNSLSIETKQQIGTTYVCENLGISTYWNYEYNIVSSNSENNTKVFNYNTIELISNGENEVTLNCDSIDELIYKAIPNAVFKALYNKLGVSNVNCGFMAIEDEIDDPYIDNMECKYLFKPIFVDGDSDNIKLDTIIDLILINGESYPLQSEYYLVTIDNEYYLYCIFNSPDNNQVLPPLLYHVNIFDETSELNNSDYEFYTNNKVDLICPTSLKNTYLLYGFDKDFVSSINTNISYAESYYKGKPTYFNINDCCIVTFNQHFENNKLTTFTKTVSNESYTYINKYTGFISGETTWGNGKFNYSTDIITAQIPKKSNLVAYITTEFTNNTDTANPIFRFDSSENSEYKNVMIINNSNVEQVDPELISNYPRYEVPQPNPETDEYEPIIEWFTPNYN